MRRLDSNGLSPTIVAALSTKNDLVRALIEAGAALDDQYVGESLLDIALHFENVCVPPIVDYLLEHEVESTTPHFAYAPHLSYIFDKQGYQKQDYEMSQLPQRVLKLHATSVLGAERDALDIATLLNIHNAKIFLKLMSGLLKRGIVANEWKKIFSPAWQLALQHALNQEDNGIVLALLSIQEDFGISKFDAHMVCIRQDGYLKMRQS